MHHTHGVAGSSPVVSTMKKIPQDRQEWWFGGIFCWDIQGMIQEICCDVRENTCHPYGLVLKYYKCAKPKGRKQKKRRRVKDVRTFEICQY